jgi:hypothetical protein
MMTSVLKLTFISITCCIYTKMNALSRRALKHVAWVTWRNSALSSHLMTSVQFVYIRPISPGWLGGSLSVLMKCSELPELVPRVEAG